MFASLLTGEGIECQPALDDLDGSPGILLR
jgi:hypothetical protein